MRPCLRRNARLLENDVVQCGAANASLIGRRSKCGATEIGPATFRPQQSGLEHEFGRPQPLVGKWSSRLAERVRLKIRVTTTWTGVSGEPAPIRRVSPHSRRLDQLPADEERAAGRAGVPLGDTPPRRAPGAGLGGAPEPFASFFRGPLFPFRAAHSAAHRAKPRPGCGTPLRGLASYAALRREPERRRGARGGVFPCSVLR